MLPPIRIFSSYSSADEAFRLELEQHLAILKRTGLIQTWCFRQIEAGDDWENAIDARLNDASIILLLVSASFLASDYCWDVEMKRALERHERGEAIVIPIVLRDCDWHVAPFAKLQTLPESGRAVSRWRPHDRAWSNVVAGIRKRIESVFRKLSEQMPDATAAQPSNVLSKESHIGDGEDGSRESLPQEDAPAIVKFHRERHWGGSRVDFSVYIDDQYVGPLRNGGSLQVAVFAGLRAIQVRYRIDYSVGGTTIESNTLKVNLFPANAYTFFCRFSSWLARSVRLTQLTQ